MLPFDPNNFLYSLCKYIARQTALEFAMTPRQLWYHAADEAAAANPRSVLRIYGGAPTNWEAIDEVSIQVETIGSPASMAMEQCNAVHASLRDSDGRPLQMTLIDGFIPAAGADPEEADGQWRLIAINFNQRPGLIGVDDRGRQQAVFNMDVKVVKAF